MLLSPEMNLRKLNELLEKQSAETFTFKEVCDAMGCVEGGPAPSKARVLEMLREMSDQIDSRFPLTRVDSVTPDDVERLTELFPENEFGMRNYTTEVKHTVRRVREQLARYRKPPAWEGKPDSMGNLLPAIGSQVSIHLGRQDKWVNHTVTGFSAKLVDGAVRIMVDVMDGRGYPNQRSIADINPPCAIS